jgi:hypothetical protein
MSSGAIEDDFKVGYFGPAVFGGGITSQDGISVLYGMDGEPKCCCVPVKCHMPDAISVSLSGFWGEWAYKRPGVYHSTHQGITGESFCTNGVSPPVSFTNPCCRLDDCWTTVRSAWFDGRADGLLDITWYPSRNVWELPDGPDGATIGYAQLCIQNPEMLEFFPGLDGDPPTPVEVDPLWFNNGSFDCSYVDELCGGDISYVTNQDIKWRWQFSPETRPGWLNNYTPESEAIARSNWVLHLPSCVYQLSAYVPTCHIIGATAGDLNQGTILRRLDDQMPPVLRPVIDRQRTPEAGEVFQDAQLLFDVYLRPFIQSWWKDENGAIRGGWDGRYNRYSVDYVCSPRYYPPVGNNIDLFTYNCLAPGGIVPPKLSVEPHDGGGGGGAELAFTIEPVAGTGSTPRDTLWRVASVAITSGGSGAAVGDKFRIDYYEDPMRGGEFRDSETPQEVEVTSVDEEGVVTGVQLVEQEYEGDLTKRVYYGRFLCHPNSVALRGTGYSEGDIIEWHVVDQPTELGGGVAAEYARARAVVTEVDENGGILDWYLPGARNGDGDDQHTDAFNCVPPFVAPGGECLGSRSVPSEYGAPCAESHPSLSCESDLEGVDCRGLYSDVIKIERCSIRYRGYVGFRASAHAEARTYSLCKSLFCHPPCSCGGDTTCFNNYCGIRTIPITFEIFAVQTRLKVDITLPDNVSPIESVADAVIDVSVAAPDENTQTIELPDPPAEAANQDDFIQHPLSLSASGQGPLGLSGFLPYAGRVGSSWNGTATVSTSHGRISQSSSPSATRSQSVSISGTMSDINDAMSLLFYWPPENSQGQDRVVVRLSFSPPGHEKPLLATARAATLVDRCEDIPSGQNGYPTCGDENTLDLLIGGLYGVVKGYEYPESRPLGGIASYEVTAGGAGYAEWDHASLEWKPQTNLRVFVDSAWDGLRKDTKDVLHVDLYAHAEATVDLDVESSTFGQITSVSPKVGSWGDGTGWFYCLHGYDQMWRANLSWNFSYDMFTQSGLYITSATFPGVIHKDGYRFPATYLCGDVPNLTCFGETLMSQCEDRTKPCKPYPNNYLWSFEYCPKDLFKEYEMMIPADNLQLPNGPTLIGEEAIQSQMAYTPLVYDDDGNVIGGGNAYPKCANALQFPETYTPCDDICIYEPGYWCEHPEAAVTHDSVCWHNYRGQNESWPYYPDGHIAVFPRAGSIYLNFGAGPIKFSISAIEDPEDQENDERERSVY